MEYFRVHVIPQECHLPTWNTPVCLTCCLQGESKIETSFPDRQLGNHSWAAGEAESWCAPSPASHCCWHGSCQYCFLLEASKPKYAITVLLEKYNVLQSNLGHKNFKPNFLCLTELLWDILFLLLIVDWLLYECIKIKVYHIFYYL